MDFTKKSLYELKKIRKVLLAEIRSRESSWRKNRRPKYGNMNKGFTVEEIRLFLSQVTEDKYWVLFSLMGMTGMRVHEACLLDWDRVDWDNRILRVFSKKTDTCRDVPLSKEALWLLDWWHGKSKHKRGPIFRGERVTRVSSAMAGKAFRIAADKAGLNMTYCKDERGYKRRRLSTHSFRHSFITHVNRVGGVKVAQRLAGHSKPSTTLGYVHPTEQEMRHAVQEAFNLNIGTAND